MGDKVPDQLGVTDSQTNDTQKNTGVFGLGLCHPLIGLRKCHPHARMVLG
jgi:hypothetical protein